MGKYVRILENDKIPKWNSNHTCLYDIEFREKKNDGPFAMVTRVVRFSNPPPLVDICIRINLVKGSFDIF